MNDPRAYSDSGCVEEGVGEELGVLFDRHEHKGRVGWYELLAD